MEENSNGRFNKLVDSARQSLAAGDHVAARKYAELMLNEFPKSEEGWLVLASTSEPEEALAFLENALRVNPGSQAARQAIRLITGQILEANQPFVKIPEVLALEDTQPIKVKKKNGVEVDSATEFSDLNEPDSAPGTQETFDLEDDPIESNEIVVDIEPTLENPVEKSMVEEFPEVQPDLPIDIKAEEDKEDVSREIISSPASPAVEKQEPIFSSDSPTVEKKVIVRKNLMQAIDHPQTKSGTKQLRKDRTDRNSQRKTFDVGIIELFLVAGFAVLLPVLVFIFFYFRR